jgi:hypothetical protein
VSEVPGQRSARRSSVPSACIARSVALTASTLPEPSSSAEAIGSVISSLAGTDRRGSACAIA